jgi:hypothetical protein
VKKQDKKKKDLQEVNWWGASSKQMSILKQVLPESMREERELAVTRFRNVNRIKGHTGRIRKKHVHECTYLAVK